MGYPDRDPRNGPELPTATPDGVQKISNEAAAMLADWKVTTDPLLSYRFDALNKKIGESRAKGDEASAAAWTALAVLYEPSMSLDAENEPYCARFGFDNDKRTALPQDLSRESLEAVSVLDVAGADPEFRARLADAKWIVSRDGKAAREGARRFLDIALHLLRASDHVSVVCGWKRLDRSVSLALRVDKRGTLPGELRERIYEAAGERVATLNDEPGLTASSAMIGALIELDEQRTAEIVEWCRKAAVLAESIREFDAARMFTNRVAELLGKSDPQAAHNATLESAEIALREARMFRENGADGWLVADRMETGIELLRKVPGQQQRIHELQRELQQEQRRIPNGMTMTSSQIPPDRVAALRADAEKEYESLGGNKLAAFGLMDLLPTLAELKASSGSVLLDMIRWVQINQRGHTIRKFDAGEEGNELARMIHNWSFFAAFRGAYIEFFRERLGKELLENKHWLVELLGASRACPPDHVQQVATGLQGAIYGDPIVALHILPVQLEGMIRHVLEGKGLQVFRLEHDMTQQARTLNSALELPEVAEILGEALTMTLRFALSERGAWNLRNEVSHALVGDSNFDQHRANYMLWITVRFLMDYAAHRKSSQIGSSDTGEQDDDAKN